MASFYDNRNFTMQWCTIVDSLTNSGHDKGAHGYGGIWGGKGASFHHNLLAHLNNRVPRFNGARYEWSGYDTSLYGNTMQAERVDFRNCVLYNWGTGGCYGGPGGGYINMVNNYYKAGPGTSHKTRVTQVTVGSSANTTNEALRGYASRYYINGNYVVDGETPENFDWQGVEYDNGLQELNGEKYIPDASHKYGNDQQYTAIGGVDYIKLKLDEPIDAGKVTTHSAEEAFNKVVLFAGASLSRDGVDSRYAAEALSGTATYTGSVTKRPGIIDSQNDVGGWPTLNPGVAVVDTDKDGIPDDWEKANGLDYASMADGAKKTLDPLGYYTNLEVYINSLVQDIVLSGNADAQNEVKEYFPAYYRADGTYVPAINGPSSDIRENIGGASEVVGVKYYSLQGTLLNGPARGTYIKVKEMGNGKRVVTKHIAQ